MPKDTCDKCGGKALFENKTGPSGQEGQACDICDQWICDDCLKDKYCCYEFDNTYFEMICKDCGKDIDNIFNMVTDIYEEWFMLPPRDNTLDFIIGYILDKHSPNDIHPDLVKISLSDLARKAFLKYYSI